LEQVFEPGLWRDLYVMLGTTSGALIGLLFVATSLHLNEIADNPIYRVRAYNQTLYLLMLVVEAALILMPQPLSVLGSELVAVNLYGLWFPVRNIYSFFYLKKAVSGGWMILRALRYIAAFLCGIFGGSALCIGWAWGMYAVTASYTLLLIGVVLNAWAIMMGLGGSEKTTKLG
jgi:hypothetical protein